MMLSDLKIDDKYECIVSGRRVPVHVKGSSPSDVTVLNLDTNREITIKVKDINKRFKAQITNLSEWRLKNGD